MEKKLDESNKGHQLLKKMGWSGSGLGREEQGESKICIVFDSFLEHNILKYFLPASCTKFKNHNPFFKNKIHHQGSRHLYPAEKSGTRRISTEEWELIRQTIPSKVIENKEDKRLLKE